MREERCNLEKRKIDWNLTGTKCNPGNWNTYRKCNSKFGTCTYPYYREDKFLGIYWRVNGKHDFEVLHHYGLKSLIYTEGFQPRMRLKSFFAPPQSKKVFPFSCPLLSILPFLSFSFAPNTLRISATPYSALLHAKSHVIIIIRIITHHNALHAMEEEWMKNSKIKTTANEESLAWLISNQWAVR